MAPPNCGRCAVLALLVMVAGCGPAEVDDGAVVDTPSTAPAATATVDPPGVETSDPAPDRPGGIVEYRIEVVATHPHDTEAFTQGLEMVDGLLLESTGLRGRSSLRLVEPATGRVVRSTPLDDELFGEGATVVGDEVWQLTWTSETALVHGLGDLRERRRVPYQGEGWGLCATADRLVMSDGSSLLTLRDRTTFAVVDRVQVVEDGDPLGRLNELECVGGLVWANVYQSTRLVAIDPSDGRVVGQADLGQLVPPGFEGDTSNVANGIAHDPDTGRFWLTGKRWPALYEVELVPPP